MCILLKRGINRLIIYSDQAITGKRKLIHTDTHKQTVQKIVYILTDARKKQRMNFEIEEAVTHRMPQICCLKIACDFVWAETLKL